MLPSFESPLVGLYTKFANPNDCEGLQMLAVAVDRDGRALNDFGIFAA
jgi:hypothetical protein